MLAEVYRAWDWSSDAYMKLVPESGERVLAVFMSASENTFATECFKDSMDRFCKSLGDCSILFQLVDVVTKNDETIIPTYEMHVAIHVPNANYLW